MNSWQVDSRTPIDAIEPEIQVRDAGQRYIDILQDFASRVADSLIRGDIHSANVSFWSGAYALGIKCCGGISMTERAKQIGVQRATISKNAIRFIEANNIQPSFYMKEYQAGLSYCKARLRVINNGNSHRKWPLK